MPNISPFFRLFFSVDKPYVCAPILAGLSGIRPLSVGTMAFRLSAYTARIKAIVRPFIGDGDDNRYSKPPSSFFSDLFILQQLG
jgi:hypothetical protein